MSETFAPNDPRVLAVADAMSVHYNTTWTWPSMAVVALNALREHYLATQPQTWVIWITDVGPKKINMIKEVRWITNIGLKEAKDFVESWSPTRTIKVDREFTSRREVEDAAERLRLAGARVNIEERR
jgi:ribosomal protein L7/L12